MHVFIFRRDFRIQDNIALHKMYGNIETTEPITPIFVLNKLQVDPKRNPYYSKKCFDFMMQGLASLNKDAGNTLSIMTSSKIGDIDVLEKLRKTHNIKTIGFNEDLTPFARKRDQLIKDWCKANGIDCITSTDEYTLVPPMNMPKPALKYTHFFEKYKTIKINILPQKSFKFKQEGSNAMLPKVVGSKTQREIALNILKDIKSGAFKAYGKTREEPIKPTTRISRYLKFGLISVREAAQAIKSSPTSTSLYKELFWRAFYDQICWHFPQTLRGQVEAHTDNDSYYAKYDSVKWSNNKSFWDKWISGKTGFPIVDAGMRELSETGYMHNRVRMIAASVLIKNLHIDWRKGEKWFATQLIDYHPSANSGGWTFISGSGANAQPYFRTFNPFLQSVKFDKDAEYIKHWIPELRNVSAKDIHKWDVVAGKYTSDKDIRYPAPIVDQSRTAEEYRSMVKKSLG